MEAPTIKWCAACEGKVSANLDICPHCGHPVSARGEAMMRQQSSTGPVPLRPADTRQIVGIERTSKSLKLQALISGLMVAAGLLMLFWPTTERNPGIVGGGMLLAVIGIVWYFVVRIKTWWRHD